MEVHALLIPMLLAYRIGWYFNAQVLKLSISLMVSLEPW